MYADVLVHHPFARIKKALIYEVPDRLTLKTGSGVLVPFQNSKKAGLVLRTYNRKPSFPTKTILGLLPEEQLLWDWQIDLAAWISDYYFCSTYDAVRLMLPSNIFRVPKLSRKRPTSEEKTPKLKNLDALTPGQKGIVDALLKERAKVSLIEGATVLEKTEIFKHLIKHFLKNGFQALFLAPEIALTPPLLEMFESSFPEAAVLHSQINEGKRAEIWKKVRSGEVSLLIGSRSALFSPFKNLGLILLDEEQDSSYKQEQSPRYHARDVSLKLAELTGAKLIVVSETPTLESKYAAQIGRYQFHSLSQSRRKDSFAPVTVVDMRQELRAQNFSHLSHLLEQKISSTLARRQKIILFLNKRGFQSSTLCRDCGQVLKGQLPSLCPHCKSPRIKPLGVGIERLEMELKKLFPKARFVRVDRDSFPAKIKRGAFDILLGTQILSKTWVPNVGLVGVILADIGLHIPDFRSSERVFHLLAQISGRADPRKGEVVIQTYSPEHPVVHFTQKHDYQGFYEQEISSREQASFPPFGKLIKLFLQSEDALTSEKKALELQENLKSLASKDECVTAAPALLPKIGRGVQWNILIQGKNPHELLKKLKPEAWKGWRVDVDPLLCV